MTIRFHRNFLKNYRKRIERNPQLVSQFDSRLKLFQKDPNNGILRNHRLTGKKKAYNSFSVSGDIRVIYRKIGSIVLLYDIGTHNQVY